MFSLSPRRLAAAACTALALTLPNPTLAQETMDEGPIAFVGHGALFDSRGNQIKVTPEFIAEAQQFYLRQLQQFVPDRMMRQTRDYREKVLGVARQQRISDIGADLMANAAALDIMINRAPPAVAEAIYDKLHVLDLQRKRLATEMKDPDFFTLEGIELPIVERRFPLLQPLKLAPTRSNRFEFMKPSRPLRRVIQDRTLPTFTGPRLTNDLVFLPREDLLPEIFGGNPQLTMLAIQSLATNNSGQAYRDQCASAGVPIPPDWGRPEWQSQGILADEFISSTAEAEVFTWESNHPEGMCIALPRWNSQDRADLLGIICLSKQWSNACFWDNSGIGISFSPAKGEIWPLSEFAGGANLAGGGTCTDCHAGQNPYIIHPGTTLGLPNLSGLPHFSDDWYTPIVKASWPQNPRPTHVAPVCSGCHMHSAGADGSFGTSDDVIGSGGALPDINSDLSGYCTFVLSNAINRTMPQGNPGSQAAHPDVTDLLDMCDDMPPPDPDVTDTPTPGTATGADGFGTETLVRVTRSNDGATRRVWGTNQYADVTATVNAYCSGLGLGPAISWEADDCGEDESSYMRFNPDIMTWETRSSGSANNEPDLCRYPLLSEVDCSGN